jgi:sortase B
MIVKENKALNYEIFLKLLDNKYLTKIDVYDLPKYLLERLDINKKLKVNIRSEILFISNFMKDNDLNTYSDLYYKKKIKINSLFDDNDKSDFTTFIKINNYLDEIELNTFSEDNFIFIMDNLINNKKENIKIIFNEEYLLIKEIITIVNNYKKKKELTLKELNITFKINYSEEYKKDNLAKQFNLNFMKITLIATIIIVSLMMFVHAYHNYKDQEHYLSIEKDLKNIMLDNEVKNKDQDIEYIEPEGGDLTTTTTTSVYDIKYDKVFEKLLSINKDTVGWLTVNNTRIDYPVVKGPDNDYYLKRDYYQNTNRHGWVFMDYRNNASDLDKNTIIYGHNLTNQSMFGTLRYTLNSSWYNKTSNQVITFNTINTNMKWQIFSIYKIPVTSDYLTTVFNNDDEYLNFINLIKNRSIYDFKQEVTATDKILTLSTCGKTSDERLVVHAKLITE